MHLYKTPFYIFHNYKCQNIDILLVYHELHEYNVMVYFKQTTPIQVTAPDDYTNYLIQRSESIGIPLTENVMSFFTTSIANPSTLAFTTANYHKIKCSTYFNSKLQQHQFRIKNNRQQIFSLTNPTDFFTTLTDTIAMFNLNL